ncbi:MAG: sugar-binding transcriptional regulator [Anaerolineae bacterium]|nr:sugar-binding transcriptional regulator [Anaerolineae bacterium]
MASLEERRLMAKIAHLYYVMGHKQSEIADQLDISQASVSRLLKRAEAERIVQVTVNMPAGVYPELEEAIQQRYGLKEVIVADCSQDDDPHILRAIGSAAAFYLENTLKKQEVVGISSWSSSLLHMVDAMRPINRKMNARVVQILGGIGNPSAQSHATRLNERLANLLGGETRFLPAPGVVGSAEARQVLLDDPFVKETLSLFQTITLALVGIGALEPSKLLASSGNVFQADELELLREAGAVGDICMQFFDGDGQPTRTTLSQRVIGMSLEQLGSLERSVGIAGGARKVPAICGAMQGGWINVLVTDRFTAQRLLAS